MSSLLVAAANQRDGIIMTQTAFSEIGLRPETEVAYLRGQIAQVTTRPSPSAGPSGTVHEPPSL